MPSLPARVRVVEVGPRDGLQNEAVLIPSADKVAFIQALAAAGLPEVEVGAFVHPTRVPAMADTAEVIQRLGAPPAGVQFTALVPNLRGLERALASGIQRVAVFTAASETFTQRNIGQSIAESLTTYEAVVTQARAAGLSVRGYVSTVAVCPYEGPVSPQRVRPVVSALLEMGVAEVSLGETIGAATPLDIQQLLGHLLEAMPASRLALHCHDTYGLALANVLAGLTMGISTVDSAAGGLGGCPYALGASGNLATEDLLYALHRMGVETGVDLSAVLKATDILTPRLGRPLPSKVAQALRAKACAG